MGPPMTGRRLTGSWEGRRVAAAGVGGCDGVLSVVVGLMLSRNRPQVAVIEDQHLVGGFARAMSTNRVGGRLRAGLRLPAPCDLRHFSAHRADMV